MLLRRLIQRTGARLASTSSGATTLLAAVIERSPLITPDLKPFEVAEMERKQARQALQKAYPSELTEIEEGPDQVRARQRLQQVLEKYGGREGEGDKSGNEHSMQRRLAQRLYLLVCVDGAWQFPSGLWEPPALAQPSLQDLISQRCGDDLTLHPVGYAPVAHQELEQGAVFYWKLLHVAGSVEPSEGVDYAWLTKDEIVDRLDPATAELASEMLGPFP